MVIGNEDLSAASTALVSGASVATISINGLIERVSIVASVNPGANYTFEGTDDRNVGTGGTIGSISLTNGGTRLLEFGSGDAAIEAATIGTADPQGFGRIIMVDGQSQNLSEAFLVNGVTTIIQQTPTGGGGGVM
jgi:hypothetical protein